MNNLQPQNWSDQFPEALLNGEINLDGSLNGFQDLQTTLDGRFQQTKIADYLVEELMMQAQYQGGNAAGGIQLRSPAADLNLEIDMMSIKELLLYEGILSVKNLNLGELVGSDSVNSDLNFKLHFQGEDLLPPSNRLKIASEWGPSFINQLTIDTLMTEIELSGTEYKLDTLYFQTTAGIFSGWGSGEITANHVLHYNYRLKDLKEIARLTDELLTKERFESYTAKIFGNHLYWSSHVILFAGLMKEIKADDLQKAVDILLKDCKKVTKYFSDFLGDCVSTFFDKSKHNLDREHIELGNVASINKVRNPYFVRL